jgi:FKBP-type peptidyl-prolyl cis-trans isomerase FkpA
MKISLVAATIIVFLTSCSKEEEPLPFEEQLAKDVALIDYYLVENGIDTKKDPTGFRYVVFAKGNDNLKPVLVDSIRANYSITLLGGSTVLTNSSTAFLVNKLIKPWKIILPLYGEGAKITLYVPSGLAYGNYPTGPIPANSNLVFEIEILKVIREFSGQLKKDIAAIDEQFKANTNIKKDISDVRYEITAAAPTNGILPLAADSIVVTYTGKLLSDNTMFDESKIPTGFRLSKSTTPKSWQRVFPSLREGTEATLYVPSGLGFGAYGTTIGTKTVPAYANLKYEVTLVKVIRK